MPFVEYIWIDGTEPTATQSVGSVLDLFGDD